MGNQYIDFKSSRSYTFIAINDVSSSAKDFGNESKRGQGTIQEVPQY